MPTPENPTEKKWEKRFAKAGNAIIITVTGYLVVTSIMMLAGNPTPMYEPDNPWTYTARLAAGWVAVYNIAAIGTHIAGKPYRAWKQKRQPTVRESFKNTIASLPLILAAYLAVKIIIGIIAFGNGASIGEAAIPTTTEIVNFELTQRAVLYATFTAILIMGIVKIVRRLIKPNR